MINFFKHISLRTQIFLSMIILVFMACLLILFATYYQYQNESIDYNIFRLNRKESQLRKQINYLVEKNNLLNQNDSLWKNYNDEFNAVIKIHNVNYSIFNMSGKALFTSFLPLKIIANKYRLDKELISEGYNVKRLINYTVKHNKNLDTSFLKSLKRDMPNLVYVYSENSAKSFLKLIKKYELVDYWMNTNLMCIGEKTSTVLNVIKWKKIFLFNPGEEEFLLYKI